MKSRYLWILILFYCLKLNGHVLANFIDEYYDNEDVIKKQLAKDKTTPECLPNAVCSVVHKRFWLPPIVKTFCKCGGSEECAVRWHNQSDSKTMKLDSFSQLKFCNQITELPLCSEGQSAMKVLKRTNEETLEQEVTALANCNCQWPVHWTLLRHSYMNYSNGTSVSNDVYKCDPLKKCKANEFCGNIRVDTFSAYYQCFCPKGTMCMSKDRNKDYVSELLYEGPIYRGTCRPFKVSSKG